MGEIIYIRAALYTPPYATEFDYLIHIENTEYIVNNFSDHRLVVCRDFNLPRINWSYNDGLRHHPQTDCDSVSKQCAPLLCNFYFTLNFDQFFPNHTSKNYTLDLIFVEFDTVQYYHSSDQLLPLDKQHHESATFILQGNLNHLAPRFSENYNFHKTNFSDLITCLECIDWDRILDFYSQGLNGVVNLFYDLILAAIDISVPKFGRASRKIPHWYSESLKKAIIDKKLVHLHWKLSGDCDIKVEFSRLRALYIRLMRKDYNDNIKNIQNMAKKDPKNFWKFINSKMKEHAIPNLTTLNDEKGDDGESIANSYRKSLQVSLLHFFFISVSVFS